MNVYFYESPIVCSSAFAVFGVFPSSAESEREFSTAGKDATATLKPWVLRVLSFLALNSDRLLELTGSDTLWKTIPKLSPKPQRRALSSSRSRRCGQNRPTRRR